MDNVPPKIDAFIGKHVIIECSDNTTRCANLIEYNNGRYLAYLPDIDKYVILACSYAEVIYEITQDEYDALIKEETSKEKEETEDATEG